MSRVDRNRLLSVAGALGVALDARACDALAAYAELLFTWNRRINLTAVGGGDELIDRHFIDAFATAGFLPGNARVVDVGSGGGLPAIPLAIVQADAEVDMFEATAKKAAFLRTAARELGLSTRLRVHDGRLALPVAPGLRGSFDIATSRATFAPADWVPLGRALVREGGRVIVFATGRPAPGLPEPAQVLTYAKDRRLLLFE
jgi:16S rRNA (guanine527-N7)-methyltransferase